MAEMHFEWKEIPFSLYQKKQIPGSELILPGICN
jgi:hypothetical protein